MMRTQLKVTITQTYDGTETLPRHDAEVTVAREWPHDPGVSELEEAFQDALRGAGYNPPEEG